MKPRAFSLASLVLLGIVALIAGAIGWHRVTSRHPPSDVVAVVEVPEDYVTCSVAVGSLRRLQVDPHAVGPSRDVPCPQVATTCETP